VKLLAREKFKQFCKEEYADYKLYSELAKREKDAGRRKLLEELSKAEEEHYLFWSRLAGGYKPKVSKAAIYTMIILRLLMGLTFTLKFFEKREKRVIEGYKRVSEELSGEDQRVLQKIIEDEEMHERAFMRQIDEGRVRYLGFIVLGLADAIVEITGVHAGFLGVTSSTLIAGIAGLVVGFAAAISMGSAAYLQAKQQNSSKPAFSALATGVAYICAVTLLASPYFLTEVMLFAFGGSLTLAVLLIFFFTLYGSVVGERSFPREFAESIALTLGTALATFLFGYFVGRVFGIHPAF
jgi:VIT1/CCC1 family predicted Fe2+/Mn2+ transporter